MSECHAQDSLPFKGGLVCLGAARTLFRPAGEMRPHKTGCKINPGNTGDVATEEIYKEKREWERVKEKEKERKKKVLPKLYQSPPACSGYTHTFPVFPRFSWGHLFPGSTKYSSFSPSIDRSPSLPHTLTLGEEQVNLCGKSSRRETERLRKGRRRKRKVRMKRGWEGMKVQ